MMLLQTAASACTFGGLNSNDWVGICVLVIVMSFMISAVIYVLANLLPKRDSEKIRGYIKFEYAQLVLGIGIVVVLLGVSAAACNFTGALTGSGQSPFGYAQGYVGGLLFQQGQTLMSSMFGDTIQLTLESTISEGVISATLGRIGQISQLQNINGPFGSKTSVGGKGLGSINFPLGKGGGITVNLLTPDFKELFEAYASVIVDFYMPILIGCMIMLFVVYISLPIISAGALTVVVPIAILLRSVSFTGPKLREAANGFLAIAIALYFVYPATFVMDSQITGWLYCTPPGHQPCNPYPQFLPVYKLNQTTPIGLLSSNSTPINVSGGTLSLPLQYWGSSAYQFFSSTSSPNLGLNPLNPFNVLFYGPNVITRDGVEMAEYLLRGVVLMALNLVLTMGLAYGLWKAFTGGLNFMGGGHIWS
ncbi:MAG: hypothetical protein KGH61_00885 [Candidatus Micrarchaeota archaeon]|nr:hypothetical protein [Candidatus Micrarchaeota archaeon]MDE1847489.1 hypothetical protein [Candidatus Micrarchaeota archaeon]MDE1863875.1 hypothetical protein [Candidatus Micrarchaeota archaeon]